MFPLFVMFLVIVSIWPNQVVFSQSTDNDESNGASTISPNDARIINGEDAAEGRWPFMASLQMNGSHLCGGAILNDDSIMTAAHCVLGESPSGIKVYIGHNKITDPDSKYLYQVKKLIPHKKFSNYKPELGYDVAVVKLDRKIDFKSLEGKATKSCLPDESDKPLAEKCIALGWGFTSGPGNGTKGSPTLKQVDLPILVNIKCNLYEPKLVYCAGFKDGKKGVCGGDSGSPLVCPSKSDPDKYLQYGITSYGSDDCDSYGYFTNPTNFLDFIRENAES